MATENVNVLGIRIGLELQTNRGLQSMIGPIYYTAEDDLFIESAAMGIVSYPDQRVTKFRIYACHVTDDTEGDWRVAEFAAQKAEKNELSYAVFGTLSGVRYGITWATFESLYPTIDAAEINALPSTISESDPNLVLVSDPYQPRLLYARSAFTAGNDADDAVLAFESNAIPVSSGQFGEYPLAIFCRRSIYAARAGTAEIPYTSVVPMTIQRNVVGRKAVVNIGGQVYYLASDGLYRLGDKDPVSLPIQNSDHINDLLRAVDETACLGYFHDQTSGRREVWISTPSRIYAYSLEHRAWFTLTGTRRQFLPAFGQLWGITSSGIVLEAGGGSAGLRRGFIQSTPIHMGIPEVLKRFRKVIVRFSGNNDVVPFSQVTDYEVVIQVVGATRPLLSFDFLAEARYAHRVRLRKTNRTVISVNTIGSIGESGVLAALPDKFASLETTVAIMSQQLAGSVDSLQSQIDAIDSPANVYKGRLTGVNIAGQAVTFTDPFASATAYIPSVYAVSGDGLRVVTVRVDLTASGMTFYPAEDNTTVYWRVEPL